MSHSDALLLCRSSPAGTLPVCRPTLAPAATGGVFFGIYSTWRRWEADGCIDAIFTGSVMQLQEDELLDVTVIHGDGTLTFRLWCKNGSMR